MSRYIATFHTHLAALRTHRALSGAGFSAKMSPVPRTLSSSCGTCVRYEASDPCEDLLSQDFEQVVEVIGEDCYHAVLVNPEG